MTRLHILQVKTGILISPVTDPLVCSYLEAFVPGYLWRTLYQHDAALVDSVLHEIGEVLPSAQRCATCWSGTPCSALLEQAKREAESLGVRPSYNHKMPAIKSTHYLRLLDSMNRSCALLLDPRKRFQSVLSQHLLVEFHYDRSVNAWYIDRRRIDDARRYLDNAGLLIDWCRICDSGLMCPAWDAGVMATEGYKFRGTLPTRVRGKTLDAQAAKTLELTLPTTDQAVEEAFRRLALTAHPDHGGTDEQMIKLIEARKRLANRP